MWILIADFLKSQLKNLTSPLAIFMGIGLVFGGAATWLREDAINDTNAKWELKVAIAAIVSHNEVQERQLKIERLEKTLALKEQEDVEKIKADQEALSKQAADFPLSGDCTRCRIPNERIWVRGAKDLAGKSGNPGSKAPGS